MLAVLRTVIHFIRSALCGIYARFLFIDLFSACIDLRYVMGQLLELKLLRILRLNGRVAYMTVRNISETS
jgi:hypothetical protein